MLLQKIYYHLMAYVKRILYCLVYNKKLSFGAKSTWRKGFSIMIGNEGRIHIGKNCFFNNYCSIASLGFIEIGDNSIFGENVKIYDHNHKFHKENTIDSQGYSVGSVRIGNDCWIGSGSIILKGAVIGDGCVIGAGVVVSETIPPYSILKNRGDFYEVSKRI